MRAGTVDSGAETVCVIATDANWSELRSQAGSVFASGVSHYSRLAEVPFGATYASFFVDAAVPDIDLWPLPVLAMQSANEEMRDHAKEVSAHLIQLQGEIKLEAIPALKALRGGVIQDMDRLTEAIAEISAPTSARKLASVRYLNTGDGVFLAQMKNGTSYLLRQNELDEADATEVVSCALSDDGEYFEVRQASGNQFEVPWDDVLYHCEPSYEYFKGRSPEVNPSLSEERASRIGGRIRALRVEKAMSVSGMARNIGMQRSNLSRVESGKHMPSLDTLERIAEALDVPVASLVAR